MASISQQQEYRAQILEIYKMYEETLQYLETDSAKLKETLASTTPNLPLGEYAKLKIECETQLVKNEESKNSIYNSAAKKAAKLIVGSCKIQGEADTTITRIAGDIEIACFALYEEAIMDRTLREVKGLVDKNGWWSWPGSNDDMVRSSISDAFLSQIVNTFWPWGPDEEPDPEPATQKKVQLEFGGGSALQPIKEIQKAGNTSGNSPLKEKKSKLSLGRIDE
jgi:hypothetical protein